MSDTDKKCSCEISEEIIEALPKCSVCVKEFMKAAIQTVMEVSLKHGCGCECNGGTPTDPTDPTDPVDPTDPTDPIIGEEELLDTAMTTGNGNEFFKPIASSLGTWDGTLGIWRAFQKGNSVLPNDAWASNIKPTATTPQYLGVESSGQKYIITKVEYMTRLSGTPNNVKEYNLKYINNEGKWVDLTDHQTDPLNTNNRTVSIPVPADKQTAAYATTGIRLEIYSHYQSGSNDSDTKVIVARMRIYGKKVS